MAERSYKIRKSTSGPTRRTVYRLTVPPDIAASVPENTEFVPEVTDEGLLYRAVATRPEPKRPAWMKES